MIVWCLWIISIQCDACRIFFLVALFYGTPFLITYCLQLRKQLQLHEQREQEAVQQKTAVEHSLRAEQAKTQSLQIRLVRSSDLEQLLQRQTKLVEEERKLKDEMEASHLQTFDQTLDELESCRRQLRALQGLDIEPGCELDAESEESEEYEESDEETDEGQEDAL